MKLHWLLQPSSCWPSNGCREVDTVLSYVQLGTPFELNALRDAARIAAACDAAGCTYVCQIMPAGGEGLEPDDDALNIAAACRVGAELGAHVIKSSLPAQPGQLQQATGFGVPVLIAGGTWVDDRQDLFASVRQAMVAGAAGVAFGRNACAADDPAMVVSALRDIVHGSG